MPQVWLDKEELAEFLNCPEEEARHAAVAHDWPRQVGVDDVLRFRLPPREALVYVLRNAAAIPPRDAVLLEQALSDAEVLRRQLHEAYAKIEALEQQLVSVQTDLQVAALRELSALARDVSGVSGPAAERGTAAA